MRNTVYLLTIFIVLQSCVKDKPRVLVFSKTKGYRHASIAPGKQAVHKLGLENGFDVDTTESAAYFVDDTLKKYSAVVFLSTTGDVLDARQQNAFKRFIQAGGGFAGVHAAADTEYDWWWYGKLVGAYFKSHPRTQKARVLKQETTTLDQQVPEPWERTDEWYNYRNIAPDLQILFKLDETSYEGGENGDNHPLVWHHEFDGGRAFYTGMGHTEESYSDPHFMAQLLMGIQYAIGDNDVDYDRTRETVMPEANRFKKKVFGTNFNEPTEMTVLPDGRIIFLERGGGVKMYSPETDSIKLINQFQVNRTFEDGMIGLTKDPDFAKNGFLYVFYSHPSRSANVLSRFHFTDGRIDMDSEKEILEIATQRDKCCHTAGSLVFDPNGNLFISTGDNTSPFESDGFSPSDEQPGRAPFDAQKSSANPNDLRGKVLRIHLEPDGTYTIPDGNLFKKGEQGTRPEIYVMGCRNPYRISVDSRTGFVYWGDVGPDAGNDSEVRGPRGYDEVNQARKPGFFGWPYFVGGNYAYADFDFATKTVGAKFDPAKPVNNSPNNTGKRELPAVSPPFIWYPYAASTDFPLMTEGSRNAMAGPIYYSDQFDQPETEFPAYLDGKLITYDWMRGWVRLVSMDDSGNITDIEPFLDQIKFNNLIDMEFGPDGQLYTLEYGTQWNRQNMDSRLSVITFDKDNRLPDVALTADVTTGPVPLTVNFSAQGSSDPDGDPLSFELATGEKALSSTDGLFKVVFDKAGVYKPVISVSDGKNPPQSQSPLTIIAGNAPPQVDIVWSGNKQFFLPGSSGTYRVEVSDAEDGSSEKGEIKPSEVNVTFDYLPQGYDMTGITLGHQRPELPGKVLVGESDCKSCHLVSEKSAGPSYREVALKYEKDVDALEKLSDKVLKGGSGVWGQVPMAAHPQLSKEQALQMVEYILSLATIKEAKGLPLKGTARFDQPYVLGEFQGAYVLTASYEDKGSGSIPALTGEKSVVLRAPVLHGADVEKMSPGIRRRGGRDGREALDNIKHGATITLRPVDFTGVGRIEFAVVQNVASSKGGTIEVYLDSKEGEKAGEVSFRNAKATEIRAGINLLTSKLGIKRTAGEHRLVLVFSNPEAGDGDLFTWRGIHLER